jgi:uncharacterized protein (TIGR02118 family)
MTVISVVYPASPEANFDFDYYIGTHIPLVQQRWGALGLQEVRVLRGASAADGSAPPYLLIALLSFTSLEAFQQAAAEHGPEIFADIPNFTSAQPVIQINEVLQ